MEGQAALEVRGLSRTFGAIRALDGVDFTLRRGEIHALAGENGAGKSTFMNVVSGVLRPSAGEILFDGKPVVLDSPAKAQALGIWLVHQEISLCADISVAENIMMASTGASRRLFVDYREVRRKAEAAIRQLAPVPVDAIAGDLSISDQQIVEIAKALVLDCRILILDEPTAALTEREVVALFAVMRRLRERGISILYVSHRMAEIFAICDRVSVFRDGRYVATKDIADTTPEGVGALMVGRLLGDLYPAKGGAFGEPVLSVEGLSGDRFTDVSFAVRRGEILGFAGLIGAGRTEIAQAICGLRAREAGTVRLGGREVAARSYRDAIDAGIVYLSKNRKVEGLFLDMSISKNVSSLDLAPVSTSLGFVARSEEDRRARELGSRVSLRTDRLGALASSLSGGNQQKVAIAKLLAIDPRVVLLDEPTRGVDVGAKAEIHRLLRELCSAGVCVIVISSELPELIGLCDRVLVIRQGRIAGEATGDDMNEERLIHLASDIAEASQARTATAQKGAPA